ncbi:glutamine synthetase family protein [Arthrobacter sp. StoSoilB5]|jgi:glutamine synthetase|uniref:glutamine synthetase family protein n=1 Tax=Arthrobacter sp. StoSoilB5 TaxID=2830992 RepID=UPI001CC4E7F6|nr:glutamine synthetase family protein [Arthrobacter sp. StoSoilB5]BCW43303.1 glutamine synthetase [Arthrobacter sp. StoSoilB5]
MNSHIQESSRNRQLTVDELRESVASGEIDTVIVAITDALGRLQGKRCGARSFLEDVLDHGAEGCNYLLAVDVEMQTVDGYAMSSWETGYGDMVMLPDVSTLRRVPWLEGTAIVQCDVLWTDRTPVAASPRQILKAQIERLEKLGYRAHVGTELEFLMFDDSYNQAWQKNYTGLAPSTQYNVDYSLLATARLEPVIRSIRNNMEAAGLVVESSKGECNLGQQEITFRFDEALAACDKHAFYKNGAKEIADQHGKSITFMSKFNEREGNSCHIHFSLTDLDGNPVLAGDGEHGFSPLMERFVAGQLAALRELAYFLAPNINSYKRFVEGSFAPTAIAWGLDNRSCALRVVGHGRGLRTENRVGGGDVNPYLAVAAMIAAVIHGIENDLQLPAITKGNAYDSDAERLPTTLRDARDLLAESSIARKAFGDDVVDHYVHAANVELTAYDSAITDWERVRGFERL